jgi:hypothetical protein
VEEPELNPGGDPLGSPAPDPAGEAPDGDDIPEAD